jgi:hypothetical protein
LTPAGAAAAATVVATTISVAAVSRATVSGAIGISRERTSVRGRWLTEGGRLLTEGGGLLAVRGGLLSVGRVLRGSVGSVESVKREAKESKSAGNGRGDHLSERGGERKRAIRRLRDLTLLLHLHQRNKIWLLLFVCMYVLEFPYRWSAWVMVIIIIKGLRSTASSGS